MTKKQREAKKTKPIRKKRTSHRKGLRKNPAFVLPFGISREGPAFIDNTSQSPFPFDMIADHAGNLLIQQALLGCSFEEKTIIASLIPLVIPILRKHGTIDIPEFVQSAN